jgi:hypothetical protein
MEESFFSKSSNYIDSINTIFLFATSIKAEERILFYDKKTSSNDKIRLGLLTMEFKDL